MVLRSKRYWISKFIYLRNSFIWVIENEKKKGVANKQKGLHRYTQPMCRQPVFLLLYYSSYHLLLRASKEVDDGEKQGWDRGGLSTCFHLPVDYGRSPAVVSENAEDLLILWITNHKTEKLERVSESAFSLNSQEDVFLIKS